MCFFVLDKPADYVGVRALARAERYGGIHYFKEQSGFWTQQVQRARFGLCGAYWFI